MPFKKKTFLILFIRDRFVVNERLSCLIKNVLLVMNSFAVSCFHLLWFLQLGGVQLLWNIYVAETYI